MLKNYYRNYLNAVEAVRDLSLEKDVQLSALVSPGSSVRNLDERKAKISLEYDRRIEAAREKALEQASAFQSAMRAELESQSIPMNEQGGAFGSLFAGVMAAAKRNGGAVSEDGHIGNSVALMSLAEQFWKNKDALQYMSTVFKNSGHASAGEFVDARLKEYAAAESVVDDLRVLTIRATELKSMSVRIGHDIFTEKMNVLKRVFDLEPEKTSSDKEAGAISTEDLLKAGDTIRRAAGLAVRTPDDNEMSEIRKWAGI